MTIKHMDTQFSPRGSSASAEYTLLCYFSNFSAVEGECPIISMLFCDDGKGVYSVFESVC